MRVIDRIYEVAMMSGLPKHKVASQIAKACNVTTQAVHAWNRGEIKEISAEHLAAIAKKFGTTTDYLISGRHKTEIQKSVHEMIRDIAIKPNDRPGRPQLHAIKEPAATYANPHVGQIPLVSWVRAGSWDEPIDNHHVGDAEDWLPCPPNCREHSTFALRISGPSMDDGSPAGYRDGELIFVDGSRIEPQHNADVVVKNGDGKVTFKRLINSNGTWYLTPLNPDWPEKILEMTPGSHIVGRVMFSGRMR
jgi:SOS-response transcriptional repressor LexA